MTKLRDGTVTFSGPVRLMVVMKKLLLIGMLLLLLPVCPSEARGVNKTRLAAVVRQYNAEPDFEVVPVGGLLMSIFRGIVRKEIDTTGDDDARRAIQLLDGLRKVVVIDYSNCEDNVKQHFNRDVAKVLKKADCLMEAKDGDGSGIRLFGTLTKDDNIRDVVLLSPEEGTMICLYGTFSSDQIAQFMQD